MRLGFSDFKRTTLAADVQHGNKTVQGTGIGAIRGVLVLAAVAEIATGAALLVVPSLVGQILLGAQLVDIAVTVARVAGIALVALGIACWPGPPMLGMLTYSAAVTLYLAYIGLWGASDGTLLWPAVVLHAILTALLTRAFMSDNGSNP
jgi:hypothetical protein